MALDLALLARHLGPPVGFVGHSFGAGQAAYVAGVWPELVRWLVILDGLGPPPAVFVEGDLAAVAADGLAAAERILLGPPRVHASLDDMASRRGRVNIRLSKAWLDHLVAHGAREVEGGYVWKVDPLFSVGLPASFSEAHLHAEHELVSCPTLVLTGSEPDTWSDMTAGEVRDRLAHLGSARHLVIEGAGHYLHLEQPDVVLAAIADFTAEPDAQEAP
jgi:pimeloyl-ACP methyl ester carboxylesterase